MLLLILALLLSFRAEAQLPAGGDRGLEERPAGTQGGVEIRDWTYQSDRLRVKAQLFVPRKAQHAPAVIFCHDGTSGISRQHRLASIRLAKAGYVVLSPSYRGEDGSQGEVEVAKGEVRDVLQALELLKALPEVDPGRIGVAGASHGALISALVAGRSPDVKAAVLAYGVMDIYRWWDYLKEKNMIGHDPITRRTYGDGPEARPQSFAIRNAVAVADSIQCPVLILQGQKDTIVPPEQAELMRAALAARNKSCQVELYPDCLHGFLVYAPYLTHGVEPAERTQTEASWKTMTAFLDRTLKNAP